MPNTNVSTRFAEVWSLLNEEFSSLDHLRTSNLGFADAFMSDSAVQRFLTAEQIAAYQRTTKSFAIGTTPNELLVKIPYIAKEIVDTTGAGTLNLCTLTASNNQVTGYKSYNPIGSSKLSLVLDDQAYLQNAVQLADSIKYTMLDQINDVWNRLDIKYQAVVEANKNQAWASIDFPTGWAVVGDAIQIPYADLDNVIAFLPRVFEQMNMMGPYNLELDTILDGKFQRIANQGTGNSVNTQYGFTSGKLNFRKSANMPTKPLGVSHVMYAQQAATSVTFSRVPDAFRSSINTNIDGKFDLADTINGLPIRIGDIPFSFGQKTQNVCNSDIYHGEGGPATIVGQPIQEKIWLTEYYGIIQPVSDPSTIPSPVLRIEILDAV